MRLLLVLVALQNVQFLVATWTVPFFGSKKDAELISLHPLSPKESDPESARSRRQAYQVYEGKDSSVTVDKSGQAESGEWGPWTRDQECSRTCGGGVQIERRTCDAKPCTGPSTRYVSCNVESCPDGAQDFRAVQCAEHDDTPLDGNYYRWLPYPGKNKCELTCKPDNANFYYKWADKVTDGTKCDHRGNDICVEGICLPVGCDNILGSAIKTDKCAVCGGDGSTCKTIEGFFDERNLSPGYHDIIRLPIGATSIRVEEMRPTTNSLAIRNTSGHFYLNGNYQIQLSDKDLDIGGTLFEYDTRNNHPFEQLTSKGPTTEELIIALLFQRGTKDSAIKYEFSVPLDLDIPYMYKPGEWSPCSVTCGKGVLTRTSYCILSATQQQVDDEICEGHNVTKPAKEKPCETVDCSAEWFEGDWEECSSTCGDSGIQYRVVYCHQVFSDGKRMTVDDSNCTSERPAVVQSCNKFSCPEWQAGPWSACSMKCGDAYQYRSVTCRSEKGSEEGKLLPAEACGEHSLEIQRSCNLGPCIGLNFFTSEWKLCEKCNDTEETRNVSCKDKTGRAYPLDKCLNENVTTIPPDTRACASPQPCLYEWHTSQWSICSTECGHGHNSRRVVCAIHQLGDLQIVDESHCNADTKPDSTKNCTNEEKCNGTYYTGPWSKCSAECGGGLQTRMIVCLNYDKNPVPDWCDEALKPAEEQNCNVDPCPTCDESDFGCCPDNTTFASGFYLEGCSNCSTSEYGCCADNITEAMGPNGEGCGGELAEDLDGSGEEMSMSSTTEPSEEKEEKCEVLSAETGEKAMIDCMKVQNDTSMGEIDGLFGNDTDENITIHCSKTEFGCCPDWITAATGKDNIGCPEFVLGVCNETANGCCPDEVTMARGPNYEGCGEPSCAASLYGCCSDRKTIAFGPHYAGCERSSFPCELSTFGCCPDGETAALGKNGTGCGGNCLVTKYGCCPDGASIAKGPNNEGCGCEYAQYGCCADGKTPAKGTNNYGCPETCAKSQFGCCPDGKTEARGPNKEGCPCQYTVYGCCPDGETSARGPNSEGCDDCRYARHGCCPDGSTKATGPAYAGCPSTTVAPYLIGGTVAPEKIISCSLPQDQGTVCHPGYQLVWYYDTAEGRCSQFWYGGCAGNDNRFTSREQCEATCVDPPANGRCFLPKMEGPTRCDQLSARYWYDYTTKQCGAFWWRGCLGNANNFETWEDCQNFCSGVGPIEDRTTPAIQTEAPVSVPVPNIPVPSHEPFPQDLQDYTEQGRWTSTDIAPTVYGRPEPQYIPVEEPSDRQLEQQIDQTSEERADFSREYTHPPPSMEEVCRLSVDSGPCGHYADMYYYDVFSGKCHPFIYGGCGGNLNRFVTKQECEARCGHTGAERNAVPYVQVTHAPVPPYVPYNASPPPNAPIYGRARNPCDERMDVGRCHGSFDSYYFEKATGTCEPFRYSGCGGTSNRFQSRAQCEETCVRPLFPAASPPVTVQPIQSEETSSVCELPKETGPCDRFVTKWYYNKADGTCSRFHYGGCDGTENRFDSEQQCKNACGDYADPCTLPMVKGPCSGKHKRFYYNAEIGECEQFEYGGCLGNTNNFIQIADCQAKCTSVDRSE